MEKKIIRRCYGRKYQLVEVPKDRSTYCPGCVFDKKEQFCVKHLTRLNKSELQMQGLCTSAKPKTTQVWIDVTPTWKRVLNFIIRRK